MDDNYAYEILAQVFGGRIDYGQVVAIDGSGPFNEDDLSNLLELMDVYDLELMTQASSLEELVADNEIVYVIVGRQDFSTDSLDSLLKVLASYPNLLHVISQEDFMNYWLFNRYQRYTPDDPRVQEHPALAYLAANSGPRWPWPSTEAQPSSGGKFNDMGWLLESQLKSRFGYNVNARMGLSEAERRRRLDQALTAAVEPMSLKDIAEHIARLVRWHKEKTRYQNAVAKWENDLAYLKEKYYNRQFVWPSTE